MTQRELTPAQRLAIRSTDRSTAIIAGAGSGKTHVLVERIVHLLTHDAHTLDQLLCITFTEKAAAELKARLLDRLPVEQHPAVTQAQISTFHAFQARILREQAVVVGIDLQATIMEESRAGLLLAQTCREILLASLSDGDADTARLIDHYQFAKVAEWIEAFVADRWHFLRTAQDDDASLPAMTPEETQISATIRGLVARVIAAYTAAKHRAAQIDFTDLEIVSLDLLCRHDTVRSAYQQRFRAILVDEAQDVNDAQAELLRQLFVPGKNTLTIVGDPKQSIYRFRGANVEAFGSLAQLITEHGGHRIALQENFRSREGVCAFVNQVAATMPDYENLVATRPAADAPAIVALGIATQAKATAETRRDQEAAQIAADLVARHATGAAFRQHVLLFQSKSDMDRYAAALRAAAIPVVQHSGGTFLDRPEVIDLLAALETIANHATGRSNPTTLLRLLRSPLIGLTDDECYRLVFPDLTTINKPRPLMEAARAHPVIGPLLHQWTEAAQHVSLPALLERIIRTTDYETHCLATDPSGQSAANIEKLYWLATSAQMRLADFLGHMHDLRRRAARMPDQPIMPDGHNVVQLMTVHAAKGLEFDVVYLADLFRKVRPDAEAWLFLPGHGMGCKLRDADDPFAEAEETPRWRALANREKEAHAAEHQRLLYVALTRARECLVLPMHEEMTRDKDTWHGVLKSIEPQVTAVIARSVATKQSSDASLDCHAGTTPARNDNTQQLSMDLRTHAPTHIRTAFTVSELDTYATCPMQYRLQYVDRIPQEQSSVAGRPLTELAAPGAAEPLIRRSSAPSLTGALLGDVIHATIRKLAERPDADPHATLLATCRQRGCTPSTEDLANAEQLIANYCAVTKHEARGTKHVFTEHPFTLQLNGTTIRGTIDALIKTDEGWDIIDYKTDRIERPEDIAELQREYALQMGIYAIASTAAEIGPIHSTKLIFLDSGQTIEHEVTPEWLGEIAQQLETIIQNIGSGDYHLSTQCTPPCARCAYHHNGTCWEDRYRSQIQTA